jgi:hypothetical protein
MYAYNISRESLFLPCMSIDGIDDVVAVPAFVSCVVCTYVCVWVYLLYIYGSN